MSKGEPRVSAEMGNYYNSFHVGHPMLRRPGTSSERWGSGPTGSPGGVVGKGHPGAGMRGPTPIKTERCPGHPRDAPFRGSKALALA